MPDPTPPVAGVRFRNAGKIFYFHTSGMRLEAGEYVIVETVRGPEVGKVVIAPDQVVVNELNRDDLKPILRLATDADIRRMDALRQQAAELLPEARRLAEDAGFPARIDAADFTLDGRRLTLSFTSEERLDYRDYLRRASDRFGIKIDLRQLGARDRAKLAGGYGICGRELCCSGWLSTFPSISIRMAKEQDLPLNPQKISGLCGRLLCCLSYEEEGYREMRRTLPKLGQRCSTPTGEGRVIGVNILRRQVTLVVDGQRMNIEDRDLGTVVRWDPASKAGDPPPSISRADAIAQGLIEATEQDLLDAERPGEADWLNAPVERDSPGRGRLPGGGPRREQRNRPPRPDRAAGAPPAAPGSPAPAESRGRRDDRQRPPRDGRGSPPPARDRGAGTPGGADQPAPEPRRQPRGQRSGGAARPASAPPPAELQGRPFRRSAEAPPPARSDRSQPPGPRPESGPPNEGRRRRPPRGDRSDRGGDQQPPAAD